MINFYEYCLSNANRFTPECGKASALKSGISVENLDECVKKSFIVDASETSINYLSNNEILDNDNILKSQYLLKYVPSILINGQQFWGQWSNDRLLEALCSGIKKKPEICYMEGGFVHSKSPFRLIVLILGIIFGISLIIFCICRKMIGKKIESSIAESELDHKVNTVVTSYLALKDKN